MIGRVGIPPSAMTPQPSLKLGQQSRSQVSTELGQGLNSIHQDVGRDGEILSECLVLSGVIVFFIR